MGFHLQNNQQRTRVYTQIHSSADRPLASPRAMPCGKNVPCAQHSRPPGDQRDVTSIRVHASNAHASKKKRVWCPFRQDHFQKEVVIHTGSVMSGGCRVPPRCPLGSGVSSPRPIRAGRPHRRRRRCCRLRRTMPPRAGRDCRGSPGGIVRPWLPWGRTDGQASVHPGR
jgi:hypothetical protein